MNFLRSLLNGGSILVLAQLVPTILGCTTAVSGAVDCTTSSWLPLKWAVPLALVLQAVNFALKAFGTGSSLTKPTAVDDAEAAMKGVPGSVATSAVVPKTP